MFYWFYRHRITSYNVCYTKLLRNEFFIFDDVKIIDDINESYYKVDSDEGCWSDATDFESGNMGHRPRTKGGYFPVQPTDSMVDLSYNFV